LQVVFERFGKSFYSESHPNSWFTQVVLNDFGKSFYSESHPNSLVYSTCRTTAKILYLKVNGKLNPESV